MAKAKKSSESYSNWDELASKYLPESSEAGGEPEPDERWDPEAWGREVAQKSIDRLTKEIENLGPA